MNDLSEIERLILDTCALLRQHVELLEDEAIQSAHAEQLARLEDLLDDGDPIVGSHKIRLGARVRLAMLNGLAESVARLRQAAEDRRDPARLALAVQHEHLLRWRDEAVTDLLREGRR